MQKKFAREVIGVRSWRWKRIRIIMGWEIGLGK